MKLLWAILASVLLAALAPSSAQAIPISYQIDFDGSVIGPAGTGSFVYDPATGTLGDFTFAVGDVTGSLAGFAPLVSAQLMGTSVTRLLFEILSGEDAHPADCRVPVPNVIGCGVFASVTPTFAAIFFASPPLFPSRYAFFPLPSRPTGPFPIVPMFSGNVAVRPVSEPAGLALVGLGLAALGWLQKRRKFKSKRHV